MGPGDPRGLFQDRSFYLDLRTAPDVRNLIKFGIEALKGVSGDCILLLHALQFHA